MLNKSRMWLLSLFPSFMAHLVLSAGIIILLSSFVVGLVPIVNAYKIPTLLVGIVISSYGFWLEGGLAYKQKTDLQIAQLEIQLAKAQADAATASAKTETVVTHDIQVIHDKGDTIIKYIQGPDVIKYDTTCVIPKEIVAAHNAAATLTTVPAK